MKIKKLLPVMVFLACAGLLAAQEAWQIPVDSPLYRQAEELFISAGVVPPYESLPLAAEDLKSQLLGLVGMIEDNKTLMALYDFTDSLTLAFGSVEPIADLGLSAGVNTEPDRYRTIPLFWNLPDTITPHLDHTDGDPDDGLPVADPIPTYDLKDIPRLINAGFALQFVGFALRFEAEVKETSYGLLENAEQWFVSIPETFDQFDITDTSLTGIISFYSPNFEADLGRGKLHYGPGQYSSLSVSKTMPYFDHVRVRLRYEWFSLTTTVCSLNPVISNMESDYLDYLYALNENPEPNSHVNGKIFTDRIKNYVNIHVVIRPWPWLSLSLMQTNLVGGRPLDLADFNPLLIIHNNFDEGTYSCPLLLSASVVPFGGLKLYTEFLFYDAAAGDELAVTTTQGAIALQGGFTLLSTPLFDAGPGRFRLDGEITYVDPYCYGKYYDLRKFTSRFMFIDRGMSPARHFVDYPLGFYLGPDCLDIHAALSYGKPGSWEAEIEWQTTGKGEIDLYGYGDDAEYSTQPTTGLAPSGIACWIHSLGASFYFQPFAGLTLRCWYRVSFVYNRFDPATRTNTPGDNMIFHYAGVSATWSLF